MSEMKPETRLKRIMAIECPEKRFSELNKFVWEIGHYWNSWYAAMDEIRKMLEDGYTYQCDGNRLIVVREG